MEAYAISGKTYPHRHALKAAGALWSHERGAYLVRAHQSQAARDVAAEHGLDVDEIEASEEELTPATGERLREIRQDRNTRRAERLHARADAAERRAREAGDRIKPHEREFLRLGEPVKHGHHSARRHVRLLERAQGAASKECEEFRKASDLRSRAEWAEATPARIAGDAERRREEIREAAGAMFAVGDRVRDGVYGDGVIAKVNAKSWRITFDRGFTQTIDKAHPPLMIERGAGVPAPKFKKGDAVLCFHHGVANAAVCRETGKPGTVVRKTPRGFLVEYVAPPNALRRGAETRREVFAEDSLLPRET